MIKKFALLLLLSGICLSTQAQIYTEDYVKKSPGELYGPKSHMVYGVMAGVLVPRMSDKQNKLDINNVAGYHLGFMWGIDMGKLEIVPEFWYEHNKSDVTRTTSNDKGDLVTHSLEIPVVFAIELGPVRLNFGPSFSLMSSSKFKESGKDDIDFGRTKSAAGYLCGASVLLKEHFILDLRYSGRFVSSSEISVGGDEHEYRYYSYSFNVGYRF